MEYIKSKDIYLLMRDILKLIHQRPMEHGSRVAYMVYKMLEEQGKYEEFELADIVMVATMHDIGAYKTEQGKLNENLRFETKDSVGHSIYGYLFFKYLSPVPDLAKIIMYHHTDYEQLQKTDYEYKEIAAYINIAEKMDLYSGSMGNQFDMRMFHKQAGTKLSKAGLELFYQCETKYGIFEKLKSGAYKEELDRIAEYMIFSNEDKKRFLEMLMYCQGFVSEGNVIDAITTICICEELANQLELDPTEKEILYYGALIHDIGMLAVPREILEAPRKLKPEEMVQVRKHIQIADKELRERMNEEIVAIALSHHERGDGSGYPSHLKDYQMNQQQRILQVADMVGAMVNKRSYRDALPKEKVIAILSEEVANRRLKRQVVAPLVGSYDSIMKRVGGEGAEIYKMYQTLNLQYKRVMERYKM